MSILCQAKSGECDLGLGLVLGQCWDLRVRPSAQLDCAHTSIPAIAMPVWADPYAVLGGADLGRLRVAAGPGDMTALAGSTLTLLRMLQWRRRLSSANRTCTRTRGCGLQDSWTKWREVAPYSLDRVVGP
jgi:hypothetical protein